jgi:hypothetical protein
VEPDQEGWYTDPYGRHEARWLSRGVPTKLVRDGRVESYDDPPNAPPTQAWTPIESPPGSIGATDMLRADDLEAQATPTLAQLSRAESSAALTAQAHPWFIARHWVRPGAGAPSPDVAATAVRKVTLIAGGVLSGLFLAFTSYVWVRQVVSLARANPPEWRYVPFAVGLALAAPVATYVVWRADRRAGVPSLSRIGRAETLGCLFSVLVFLLFWASLGY